MEINYLLIEEENEQDFVSVLPPELNREENRICIGAVDENNAVLGAISYFLVRYEYVIDWVFVVPPVRRRRVGAGLLGKVIETILHAGDLFPIVARFPYTDKEHAVFSLFQSEERMTTSYSHERFVVSPKELANAARLWEKAGQMKGQAAGERLFFDLSAEEQQQTLTEMRLEYGFVINHPGGFTDRMVPSLCRCIVDKGTVTDLVLVQKLQNGDLEASFVYGKNPIGLFTILRSITAEAKKSFPNASLSFDAANEKSLQLAKKLFPRVTSIPIFEAAYL